MATLHLLISRDDGKKWTHSGSCWCNQTPVGQWFYMGHSGEAEAKFKWAPLRQYQAVA